MASYSYGVDMDGDEADFRLEHVTFPPPPTPPTPPTPPLPPFLRFLLRPPPSRAAIGFHEDCARMMEDVKDDVKEELKEEKKTPIPVVVADARVTSLATTRDAATHHVDRVVEVQQRRDELIVRHLTEIRRLLPHHNITNLNDFSTGDEAIDDIANYCMCDAADVRSNIFRHFSILELGDDFRCDFLGCQHGLVQYRLIVGILNLSVVYLFAVEVLKVGASVWENPQSCCDHPSAIADALQIVGCDCSDFTIVPAFFVNRVRWPTE